MCRSIKQVKNIVLVFVLRHPRRYERGMPEVWLSGFSAYPQGEPRERTGETVVL